MTFAVSHQAPSALYSRATDRSQGSVAIALGESVANALATTDFEERDTQILRRVAGALHRASRSDGIFTSPEAVGRVFQLLLALSSFPLPEVIVESETEIGLDWDEGPHRVVSLTVRENPMIGYSAFFGAEPIYGRTPFSGEVPETIRFLLRRLYPQRSAR